MPNAYYIADSGELTCDACTFSAMVDIADGLHRMHGAETAPRAWRAAVRLAVLTIGEPLPYDVLRILTDSRSFHFVSGAGARHNAIIAAEEWHRRNVADVTDSADSPNGEYCGGCSLELVAPWCECEVCGRDGYLGDSYGIGADPFAITYAGDSGDGFRVVCGECWTEWRAAVDGAGLALTEEEETAIRDSLDANGGRWEHVGGRLTHIPAPYNLRRQDDGIALGLAIAPIHRARIAATHVGELFPATV